MPDDTDTNFTFRSRSSETTEEVNVASHTAEASESELDVALSFYTGETLRLANALRDTLVSEGCPWPAGVEDAAEANAVLDVYACYVSELYNLLPPQAVTAYLYCIQTNH